MQIIVEWFWDYKLWAVQGLIGALVKDCCSAEFISLRTDRKRGRAAIKLTSSC